MEKRVSPGRTTYCPEVTAGRLAALLLRSTTPAPLEDEDVLEQPVTSVPKASATISNLMLERPIRCRMTV